MTAQLPSLFRDELFHPAVVHFPIAFLALSGFLGLMWLLMGSGGKRPGTALILVLSLGVIGGWLAILTGGWAEDVVNRVICDPTVTHAHEDWGERAVWSASLAWPIVIAGFIRPRLIGWKLRMLACILLLSSAGSVLYAGHLGATLVYQQGAGVYRPTEQCTEFE